MIVAGRYLTGYKHQPLRADRVTFDHGLAHLSSRVNGRQMLAHQSRFRTSCSDLLNLKGLAGDHHQGERRTEDLSAPFATGTVELNHGEIASRCLRRNR